MRQETASFKRTEAKNYAPLNYAPLYKKENVR
jgi:hypothetical protein